MQFDNGNGMHCEAKTDDHNNDITAVTITGSTATVTGSCGGQAFTIVLTDGGDHGAGPNHGDTITVTPPFAGAPDHFDVKIDND